MKWELTCLKSEDNEEVGGAAWTKGLIMMTFGGRVLFARRESSCSSKFWDHHHRSGGPGALVALGVLLTVGDPFYHCYPGGRRFRPLFGWWWKYQDEKEWEGERMYEEERTYLMGVGVKIKERVVWLPLSFSGVSLAWRHFKLGFLQTNRYRLRQWWRRIRGKPVRL